MNLDDSSFLEGDEITSRDIILSYTDKKPLAQIQDFVQLLQNSTGNGQVLLMYYGRAEEWEALTSVLPLGCIETVADAQDGQSVYIYGMQFNEVASAIANKFTKKFDTVIIALDQMFCSDICREMIFNSLEPTGGEKGDAMKPYTYQDSRKIELTPSLIEEMESKIVSSEMRGSLKPGIGMKDKAKVFKDIADCLGCIEYSKYHICLNSNDQALQALVEYTLTLSVA